MCLRLQKLPPVLQLNSYRKLGIIPDALIRNNPTLMKVILLKDVAKIGKRFDIVEVPNGYAQNMLIPRAMALPATPENVKRAGARKDHSAAVTLATNATFSDVAARIKGAHVPLTVEANEQGHLFMAVKAEMIVEALKEAGYEVTKDQVVLPQPIKALGEFEITLANGKDQVAFMLDVVNRK
jgi:large subunit ribosomal protein L9